ncbi:MAG: ExeM/NucH family extracellular endonuclease [Acidimicrobiia bacterium]
MVTIAMVASLLPWLASEARAATPTELFFSEYVEGASFDKAVEIYNGTGSPVDLGADDYEIEIYFNGSTSAGTTVDLSGTIADGDVFVVADDDASAAILAQTDQTSSSNFFNGNDGVVLTKGGVNVDTFGQSGVDPGTEWLGGGENDTLRRKDTVCAGDTDFSDSFDASGEWDSFAQGTLDGLGSHSPTCSNGSTPSLVINEIHADPASGTAGDANGDGTRDSGDDEFVEIYNDSGSAVDISGWTISDGFGLRHTFPTNTVIDHQCAVVVFGGDTVTGPFGGAVTQTASSGALGLNNTGDTVTLNNGSTDVTAVTYGSEGNDNQSLTRDADVTGSFVKHSIATGSSGALFSPGTSVDGTMFTGCTLPSLQGTGEATPDFVEPLGSTLLTVTVAPAASPPSTGVAVEADLSAIGGSATQAFFDDGMNGDAIAGDNVFSYSTSVGTTPDTYNLPAGVSDLEGNSDTTSIALTVLHRISQIQGSSTTIAITGPVTVRAVVTTLFEDDDAVVGFFIQEEDSHADADGTTSEGIFVYCGSCPTTPAVGSLVTVSGSASDFHDNSEISAFGAEAVVIESSGNAAPSASLVYLPASASTRAEATFEAVEGMRVTFPDTLYISEYFNLARFGELVLTVDARPRQFTDGNEPTVAGYSAFLDDLATRRIFLDDNNNNPNDGTDAPDFNEPYYYPGPGLSTTNFFRGGESISGLTGVMDWSWAGFGSVDAWRIRPITGADYTFDATNPRTASPDDVGGSFTVAAFNVLNYFYTIDLTSSGSVGDCGPPPGNQDCRGADSVVERDQQRSKIVAALAEIDADVVGLIELENDGDDASIADLVTGLNAVSGAGTYDYVATGFIGPDVIKVGLIYKPTTAMPVGEFKILNDAVDPDFIEAENRPVLVQTFQGVTTGERFTVAVNHFKSKGSDCDDLSDPDLGDGAGNCNLTRTAAADALASYLAGDPTDSLDSDFLIIGDLNSYAMEEPIVALEDAGYTDLLRDRAGPDVYTYVFDGQLGYLDYALANESLNEQVTDAASWNINADEVNLLDYNDAIRDTGERSFERKSNALTTYAPDPYRASDHDPVIVGLGFTSPRAKKLAAVVDLEDLIADGTRSDDRLLSRAIRDLNRSLAGNLWDSDLELDPDDADLVFTRERQAVRLIMQLSEAVRDDAVEAVDYMVTADRQLAVIAIGEAIGSGGDVTAALRFLGWADDERADGDYEMAITRYKQAWENAVAATLP